MRHGARSTLYRERYEDVILRSKPVMYVPMQGPAAALKELIKGVSVTEGNGPISRGSGFAPGVEARRFSSSGADNDYLEIGTADTSYHPGDTFSVGGWFNRLGAGGTVPTIHHNGDSPANDHLVGFTDNTLPQSLILRLAGTGQAFTTTRTFGASDGWHHTIFVHVGNPTLCYLDGIPAAGTSTNRTFGVATNKPLFAITPGLTNNDFDGATAHWAVWNRGLTAGEIRELYIQGIRQT